MANTFDMVNNALMRELERLDDCNPTTDAGRREIERAMAVKATCEAAIANANATVKAFEVLKAAKADIKVPSLLGGGKDGQVD